jgi:hypothetical protein
MPTIRILQAVSGVDFSWSPGEEVDVDGPTAQAWADGYRAELVRGEPAQTPERATRSETTARPRARGAKQ